MEVGTLIRVLARRRAIRRHERWNPEELARHQRDALAELRRHAMAGSRFYQDFHRGLDDAPLASLPVMTKATLMEHFDEIAVDPTVRRDDALAHVERGREGLYLDRYIGWA